MEELTITTMTTTKMIIILTGEHPVEHMYLRRGLHFIPLTLECCHLVANSRKHIAMTLKMRYVSEELGAN